LESESSLATYFWRYEHEVSSRPQAFNVASLKILTQSKESVALSKDLKKRGRKFVGPTIIYAFMQAIGIVNYHEQGCHVREAVLAARCELKVPS
jgi:DNA-3-methyladenine glycosylase I